MPTVEHSFLTAVDALALHLGCTHNKALDVLDHERGLMVSNKAHSLVAYRAMDRTEERLVLNPVGRQLVHAALSLEVVTGSEEPPKWFVKAMTAHRSKYHPSPDAMETATTVKVHRYPTGISAARETVTWTRQSPTVGRWTPSGHGPIAKHLAKCSGFYLSTGQLLNRFVLRRGMDDEYTVE